MPFVTLGPVGLGDRACGGRHIQRITPHPPRASAVAVNVAVRWSLKAALARYKTASERKSIGILVSRLGFEPRTRGLNGRPGVVHGDVQRHPTKAVVPALVHPLPYRGTE
jgi:hypothetical protein